jgi:hypothetical protein
MSSAAGLLGVGVLLVVLSWWNERSAWRFKDPDDVTQSVMERTRIIRARALARGAPAVRWIGITAISVAVIIGIVALVS